MDRLSDYKATDSALCKYSYLINLNICQRTTTNIFNGEFMRKTNTKLHTIMKLNETYTLLYIFLILKKKKKDVVCKSIQPPEFILVEWLLLGYVSISVLLLQKSPNSVRMDGVSSWTPVYRTFSRIHWHLTMFWVVVFREGKPSAWSFADKDGTVFGSSIFQSTPSPCPCWRIAAPGGDVATMFASVDGVFRITCYFFSKHAASLQVQKVHFRIHLTKLLPHAGSLSGGCKLNFL